MENFFIDLVKNGAPSAVVLGIGILWLNGKISDLDKSIRERCGLIHKEIDRRIQHLEDKMDTFDV